MLVYHGVCHIPMTHGVLERSTFARSALSHSYWALPSAVAAYEQRLTTCAGPASKLCHRNESLPTDVCWLGYLYL